MSYLGWINSLKNVLLVKLKEAVKKYDNGSHFCPEAERWLSASQADAFLYLINCIKSHNVRCLFNSFLANSSRCLFDIWQEKNKIISSNRKFIVCWALVVW
jgi:hypothetical protein